MSKTRSTPGNEGRLVRGPEDIPAGLSDEEQLEFWETHEITDEYLAKAKEAPPEERPRPRPRDRHRTLRLDKETVAELSALADERGVPFQTLARELLLEGVRRERQAPEEQVSEERGGVAPAPRSTGFDAAHGAAGMGSGGSFGMLPGNKAAMKLLNLPTLAGMAGPPGVLARSLARGMTGGLAGTFRPEALLGPAAARDALLRTQQIITRGMLESHAEALSFGARKTLRRLGPLGVAGLQAQLAREAIKGALGPAAGGARTSGHGDSGDEDEGHAASSG